MTDVSVTYSYNIPNDQFIEDFSNGETGTFTYNGPEVLLVTVPAGGSAYTQKLDGPVYDTEQLIQINVTENPELLVYADLLWGIPEDYEAEFENVTLDDGTVYADQTNKRISDYYWMPVYNEETEEWKPLQLLVKDTLSAKMRTEIAKGEQFIEILERFSLEEEDEAKFRTYKEGLASYRNVCAMPWKYPGTNPFDLLCPKIPMALVNAKNTIKQAGLEDS